MPPDGGQPAVLDPTARGARTGRYRRPSTATATPVISSITVSGYPKPAAPAITVTGTGFGARPANGISPATLSNCGGFVNPTGLDYGKSDLWLLDGSASAGLYGAWQFGANFTSANGNCGGVIIYRWTNHKIVFGLGSAYPARPFGLQSGDTEGYSGGSNVM
jgi:hypothetical protein